MAALLCEGACPVCFDAGAALLSPCPGRPEHVVCANCLLALKQDCMKRQLDCLPCPHCRQHMPVSGWQGAAARPCCVGVSGMTPLSWKASRELCSASLSVCVFSSCSSWCSICCTSCLDKTTELCPECLQLVQKGEGCRSMTCPREHRYLSSSQLNCACPCCVTGCYAPCCCSPCSCCCYGWVGSRCCRIWSLWS